MERFSSDFASSIPTLFFSGSTQSLISFPSPTLPFPVPFILPPSASLRICLMIFWFQSPSEHWKAGLATPTPGFHSMSTQTWCHRRLRKNFQDSPLRFDTLTFLLGIAFGHWQEGGWEGRLLGHVSASKIFLPVSPLAQSEEQLPSNCPALSQGFWCIYRVFSGVCAPSVF